MFGILGLGLIWFKLYKNLILCFCLWDKNDEVTMKGKT
jgi:hypothetical protein